MSLPRRPRRVLLAAFPIALALAAPAAGQAPDRVRVFVDCPGQSCDVEHLRREIEFVEYVRDPADADVHLLVTAERVGLDAAALGIRLIGRGRFAAAGDEFRLVGPEDETLAERRDRLTQAVRLALLRYVARTSDAGRIGVAYQPDRALRDPAAPPIDPWNAWVFQSSLSGSFGGEESTSWYSVVATQRASHVSEKWKGGITLTGGHDESRFEIDDSTTVTSTTGRYRAEWLLVRSVQEHWGVGLRGAAVRSTFDNYDLRFRVAPTVEYNIFPYAESSRRDLRLLYSYGFDLFNYDEVTIFDETEETLFDHTLTVLMEMTQPWGLASGGIEASAFQQDLNKNRLVLFGAVDVRVARGLGIFASGEVSRIRDQINLPAAAATEEQILLRNRILSTPFSYNFEVGLSYTFGSIYAGVVNTRFGS